MDIRERLGRMVPEKFRPPIVAKTYEDYLAVIQSNDARDVYASPTYLTTRSSLEDIEEGITTVRFFVEFKSLSNKGRRIIYRHTCGEIRSSTNPLARDTRSIMVPDWDIRSTVIQRFTDTRVRTFLSARHMLNDIWLKVPQANLHLLSGNHETTTEEVEEIDEIINVRKLQPWPNTPGFYK